MKTATKIRYKKNRRHWLWEDRRLRAVQYRGERGQHSVEDEREHRARVVGRETLDNQQIITNKKKGTLSTWVRDDKRSPAVVPDAGHEAALGATFVAV